MAREISTHASLLLKLRSGGDASSWREFDDRYRDLIFGFARRRGFQPADADDIAQETLAAVVRAIENFEYDKEKGRFRGWLKTTVLHALMKRRRAGADALDRAVDNAAAIADAAADPGADADWETEWRRYHVRTATSRVRAEFNARDLAAFERCAVEGESPSDVALALDLSVDSVYQARSRILRRIREYVSEQIAEEG